MDNILFVCLTATFLTVILLADTVEKQKGQIELLETNLKECRKQSFERHEMAKDLSNICDEFQSSRRAKNKYIKKHEIIN